MKRIEIYTRSTCQFCYAAKRLLAMRGLDFEEYPLERDPRLLEEMIERTGRRTVPQVILAGEPLGGFQELSALDREGRLLELAEAS